jgi:hypothetical protein
VPLRHALLAASPLETRTLFISSGFSDKHPPFLAVQMLVIYSLLCQANIEMEEESSDEKIIK